MKKIGIIRKTDSLGRIVLPIEMRRALEWDEHTELEIFAEQDGVFLRQYKPFVCVFCGNDKNVHSFEERPICENCLSRLKSNKQK